MLGDRTLSELGGATLVVPADVESQVVITPHNAEYEAVDEVHVDNQVEPRLNCQRRRRR